MASKPLRHDEPARRTLFQDEDFSIALSLYAPGGRQDPHSHDSPSVSVLMAGALIERAGATEIIAERGAFGIKPDGLRHSNVYGPDGAILLSVTVHSPEWWNFDRAARAWSWNDRHHQAARFTAAAVRREVSYADLAADLMSLRPSLAARQADPPAWLREVRQTLSEQPDVPLRQLATLAGVHRVHLCRSFSRWYGLSLTAFRLRRRTELGLSAYLHNGTAAAAVAFDAGFADQSHFGRTVKQLTGMTPGELRALCREVT